jgi:hypothetical protein
MNAVLWVLQAALAVKAISTTYTHGVQSDPIKMQRGMQRLAAAARPVLTATGICTLALGVGLLLPAATGFLTWLTPLSAAVLALMMLASIAFHLACREKPAIAADLVLFALATFVAYGRWVLAPL